MSTTFMVQGLGCRVEGLGGILEARNYLLNKFRKLYDGFVTSAP